MIAPNDTIAITNNTVGGSGRVRAQKQVIVGSRVVPQTPLPAAWLATGHAKPAAGGYYTGPTDRTYTFTTADSGSVGAGTLRLNWNDGASGSGTLNFGAGYLSPTLLDVSNGVKLGLLSGAMNAGESFTVAATTPRDTFQYTITAGHESDFTPPVVLVSYNDPQGNHRFGIPTAAMALASPTDNLMAFSGQMLQEPGVEIVTRAAFTAGANTTNLVVNNPTQTGLTDARLFLEFIDPDGVVVSETPVMTNLPAGPNVVPIAWNSDSFSPVYDPAKDYIVMAFWTDYQGNILDTAARPLSSFQEDPKPAFAMSSADETWDFGTAAQGTVLKRSFTFANTGALDLLTYISAPAGLTVSQTGSRSVGSADMTAYEMALNTANLAVGAYDGKIIIRTSDPDARERTVHVVGMVTSALADTPVDAMQRPLDWPAPVSGTQGQWVDFAHTLRPQWETLHPVKVYEQDGVLKGLGKYATSFGAGTASYDMFGDGRDGVMPSSSNLDNNNGTGVGVINSGTKDTYTVSVTDAWGVWRVQPGDAVLIHQTQGTNAGCWEINRAISDFGGGTATYQLAKPLKCNYASGGNNHAQIQRVPQYTACSVSGTMTPLSGWNGTWGGIFAVMCSETMTVSGSISTDGTGYLGGSMISPPAGPCGVAGNQGEGIAGGRNTRSTSSNVNGGGGGWECNNNGGAGGGHATAGASGHGGTSSGGTVVGESTMSSAILFGGAGGSGAPGNDGREYGGYGGNGGGIVWIGANTLVVNGAITARGASGQGDRYNDREVYGGGGGAGGSIKIQTAIATLDSNRLQANGGSGGSSGRSGGAGGTGRIRIEYCDTLSGSTNPPTSTQKLNCYIADQATDPTHGLLKLPESGAHTYQVQYGRKLNWSGAASQETKLRVPAGIFTSVTLQALVSDLPSNASFALEVGDPYAACWSQRSSAITAKTSAPIWHPVSTPTGPVTAHPRRAISTCPSASPWIAPARCSSPTCRSRRLAARPAPSGCPSGRRSTAA